LLKIPATAPFSLFVRWLKIIIRCELRQILPVLASFDGPVV